MSSTQTFNFPLERERWFRDRDGVLSTSKHKDDIVRVLLDLTDSLGSDTISSVTYTDSGLTTSAKSSTTTTITFDITNIGETLLVVTLSNSREINFKVRGYDIEGAKSLDYR
jgi:hypothetical protein